MYRCLRVTGRKKKEIIYSDLQSDIKEIVEEESQIDPQFKTERCYVKISAAYIRKELLLNKSYQIGDFCLKTVNNILNRLGYTLKKVLKIKPLKKIPETDAIFENVRKHHQSAKLNPRILRV